MKLLDEFKAFALKGNVVDMAVGIIIGGAFGKIVSSLVSDIIMPLIGILIGGINFSNLHIVLQKAHTNEATGKIVEAVTLNYGNFIQTTIDFLIIAFSIFIAIKFMNKLRTKKIVFQKVCKSQFYYFCNGNFKNDKLWNLHVNKSRK